MGSTKTTGHLDIGIDIVRPNLACKVFGSVRIYSMADGREEP